MCKSASGQWQVASGGEYNKNLMFGLAIIVRYGLSGGRNARKSVCCIIFPLIVNTAQTLAERALGAKVNVKKATVQSN
jgi:hypothetical protein